LSVSRDPYSLSLFTKRVKFGVWVNQEALEIGAVPSFYAVATSDRFSEVINDTEDLHHKISIERIVGPVDETMEGVNFQSFNEALIRIRKVQELFRLL
tara:strand:- start:233 stop:526 length:294 start_codon:yes stop_codon:yes gene_type:complete